MTEAGVIISPILMEEKDQNRDAVLGLLVISVLCPFCAFLVLFY